ncbi:MAG: hypothetical protein RLZZ323_1326 [Bacteroidota bacterium]
MIMENRSFKPMHVFQTILEIHNSSISINDRLDMINLYYCIEAFIENCRSNNLHFSDYLKNKVILSYNELDTRLKESMNIIYYPAMAFYNYYKKDFNLANDNIDKSIYFIEQHEHLNVNFVLAKIEQSINKYKIYYKDNKLNEANKIGNSIIDFLAEGSSSEFISKSALFSSIPKKELNELFLDFKSLFVNDFKTYN